MNLSESPLTLGIVIATNNRPESMRACLLSIDNQKLLPDQTIIIDSSVGGETRDLIASVQGTLRYQCEYRHSAVASAARQRNLGAENCTADIVLFLDDDVILEDDFIGEILSPFQSGDSQLAGVSGTITNQTYSDPKGLNRFLLGLCLGRFRGSFAGKVLGPAVNFLPADRPDVVQDADWLPTTCTAYRRTTFLAHRFETTFEGYSFAEDVHLSTRIARVSRLVNTTRARVFHADLGKDTHRDWIALGESQVRNRWLIMTHVLGRDRLIDHIRLFAYEMIYTPIAWLAAGRSADRISKLVRLLRGKLRGFRRVWITSDPLSDAKAKSTGWSIHE